MKIEPKYVGDETIVLKRGDWMNNPVSTTRPIRGPATVWLKTWPDGGVNVSIEYADEKR